MKETDFSRLRETVESMFASVDKSLHELKEVHLATLSVLEAMSRKAGAPVKENESTRPNN